MSSTVTLLTVSSQHTGTTASRTSGSLVNKTGGVRLPTSATSSAITAGSGNASVIGTGAPTRNSAASFAAPSSRYSSASNGNESTPTYDVGVSGWVRIRKVSHTCHPFPFLQVTDVYLLRDTARRRFPSWLTMMSRPSTTMTMVKTTTCKQGQRPQLSNDDHR